MKRVYLSHPYGGRPENVEKAETLAEWYKKTWSAEGKDYEIVNPLAYLAPVAEGIDEWTMLRLAINLMRSCDAVIFAPGWKRSRGCRMEHMASRDMERYEIPAEAVA